MKWIIAGGIVIGLAGVILIPQPQEQTTLQVINIPAPLSLEAKDRMVGHRERLNEMRENPTPSFSWDRFNNLDPERRRSFERRLLTNDLKLTGSAIAAYNELHVIPYNQRDYDCTQLIREEVTDDVVARTDANADNRYGGECRIVLKNPPHPYYRLSMEDLLPLLATGDAEAAAVLGDRYRIDGYDVGLLEDQYGYDDWTDAENLQYRYDLMLTSYHHATALSGKPGPLLKIELEVGASSKTSSDQIIHRAALIIAASKLQDPRAHPAEFMQKANRNMVLILPADWEAQAEKLSDKILLDMAKIEESTIGTNVMRGAIDA